MLCSSRTWGLKNHLQCRSDCLSGNWKCQSTSRCKVQSGGLFCGLDMRNKTATWVNLLRRSIITILPSILLKRAMKQNAAKIHCISRTLSQHYLIMGIKIWAKALCFSSIIHCHQYFSLQRSCIFMHPVTKKIVWHRDSVILSLNHTDPFNQQEKKLDYFVFALFRCGAQLCWL